MGPPTGKIPHAVPCVHPLEATIPPQEAPMWKWFPSDPLASRPWTAALCALVVVALWSLGLGYLDRQYPPGPPNTDMGHQGPRYEMAAYQSWRGPTVLRLDTVTGQVTVLKDGEWVPASQLPDTPPEP